MRVTPLLEGITLPSHTGAHIISCSDFPCQFAALPGGFSVFIAGCKKSCNLSITAHFWRRVRDLNPRDAHHAYTISNRAPSTTQPTLHLVKLLFVGVNRSEQYVLYRPFAVSSIVFLKFFKKFLKGGKWSLRPAAFTRLRASRHAQIHPSRACAISPCGRRSDGRARYSSPRPTAGSACPAVRRSRPRTTAERTHPGQPRAYG